MFDGGYLDQLLPYLEELETAHLFGDMCDIMGFYIRYGIENRKSSGSFIVLSCEVT